MQDEIVWAYIIKNAYVQNLIEKHEIGLGVDGRRI
jgi:hypothetical protein